MYVGISDPLMMTQMEASRNQSISNKKRWVAGLLGQLYRHLMVQSLIYRFGIKHWVDGLALDHFKVLINSYIFLSYRKNLK